MNSLPLTEKNGTPASPAIALASKRLSRSGRSVEQHALGDAATEFLELLRRLQEVDDLLQVGFDSFESGDVIERHHLLAGFESLRRTLAESGQETASHDVAARATKHHEQEEQDRQRQTDQGDEVHDLLRVVWIEIVVADTSSLELFLQLHHPAGVGGAIEGKLVRYFSVRLAIVLRRVVRARSRHAAGGSLVRHLLARRDFGPGDERAIDATLADADSLDVVSFQFRLEEARRDQRPFLAPVVEQQDDQTRQDQGDEKRVVPASILLRLRAAGVVLIGLLFHFLPFGESKPETA